MNINNLSKTELQALVAQQQAQLAAKESGLIVKENSKGGIYIKDNTFREYSTAKAKHYVAGLNIGKNTAKALFGNADLLEKVRKQVIAITGTVCLLLALTGNLAMAQDFYNYKDNAVSVDYNTDAFVKSWQSKTPACIKDGAKLLKVNKAYKAAGFGYRDCSNSDAAKRKQRKLGYAIAVFKFDLLPTSIMRKVLGK